MFFFPYIKRVSNLLQLIIHKNDAYNVYSATEAVALLIFFLFVTKYKKRALQSLRKISWTEIL